jgi:AcrR family transcriptional regulator
MTHGAERTPDRRVQKTRKLLHEALVSLLHEKNYDDIVVKEVLDRANVGRSTFYTHFRDKDDLLVSGIRDLLNSIRSSNAPASGNWREKLLWFSLPIYEHVGEHRRRNKLKIGPRGRIVLHEQLQRVLVELISRSVKSDLQMRRKEFEPIPPDLLIQHVALTFIMVLNWSVERKDELDPKQVNAIFRALVAPILTAS